jgi:hypothetical protein
METEIDTHEKREREREREREKDCHFTCTIILKSFAMQIRIFIFHNVGSIWKQITYIHLEGRMTLIGGCWMKGYRKMARPLPATTQ